jgi:hypothetical protein
VLVYSQDFEGAIGAEWSVTQTDITPVGARRFLGQFYNQPAQLTLNSLPAHSHLTISFELFILRSWDGNNLFFLSFPIGPDIWSLSVVGGPVLLNATFAVGDQQSFPSDYPLARSRFKTGSERGTVPFSSRTRKNWDSPRRS